MVPILGGQLNIWIPTAIIGSYNTLEAMQACFLNKTTLHSCPGIAYHSKVLLGGQVGRGLTVGL